MIRPGTRDDVPQAAGLRQRAWPDTIITADGMRHFLDAVPERVEQTLLAFEENGRILGWAGASRAWWTADPSRGAFELVVDPEQRGRGIATALADEVEAFFARIGVESVRTDSADSPDARALATHRGFREIGSSSVSAVDPRTVEAIPLPDGVTVVPFSELDDPEPVWQLDLEVSRDIPNEDFDHVELDEWSKLFWRSPVVDDDASLAAYVDGELVAITMIRVDRPSGRGKNNLAGTRGAHRGRGIATALKSQSLVRAAALGATIVLTDNEEQNAPMLTVNAKLGYRPFARRITWERSPTASA